MRRDKALEGGGKDVVVLKNHVDLALCNYVFLKKMSYYYFDLVFPFFFLCELFLRMRIHTGADDHHCGGLPMVADLTTSGLAPHASPRRCDHSSVPPSPKGKHGVAKHQLHLRQTPTVRQFDNSLHREDDIGKSNRPTTTNDTTSDIRKYRQLPRITGILHRNHLCDRQPLCPVC